MTTYEIYLNLYKFGGIYGYMYGSRNPKRPIDEDIIWISQKVLRISNNGECFIYIWGYPGPDYNKYNFSDYSITWAFDKQILIDNANV